MKSKVNYENLDLERCFLNFKKLFPILPHTHIHTHIHSDFLLSHTHIYIYIYIYYIYIVKKYRTNLFDLNKYYSSDMTGPGSNCVECVHFLDF